MITMSFTRDGANIIPERTLTEKEQKTVTSKASNGATMMITYYQGDEPVIEQDSVIVDPDVPNIPAMLSQMTPDQMK